MVNRDIIVTSDGSDTVFVRDLNQHYHSTFGAVQESRHVFVETGFLYAAKHFHSAPVDGTSCFNILEIGFGTGLNALLTQIEAEKHAINVNYTALEPFPLEEKYWRSLNYPHLFGSLDYSKVFEKIHMAGCSKPGLISQHFKLHKIQCLLESYFPPPGLFNLIYFDAFSPDAQPELWTAPVFLKLCNAMSPGGILVTYSVKGDVVRALQSSGFSTAKLAGPPGKRHILRAVKL